MLQLNAITLRLGQKTLLDNASLRLDVNQKAGLIGRNGAGKTSLLKLLRGELTEDQGEVQLPQSWRVAHLAQALPQTQDTAFAYVRSGDADWTDLQQQISEAEKNNDGVKLANLYTDLETIDGYRIDTRVSIILNGLGFSDEEFTQPVQSFSGGWQMRLQLARVLISRADLLLLDEPTNHLDFETILWLTRWCQNCKATMLIISHDRYFLDEITTHTIHLAHQTLTSYQGNYSSFARQRQEKLLLQEKSNEKVLRKKAHLQKFVDRFRAKASKAKQAQSRLKAMEKLQTTQTLKDEDGISFEFFEPKPTGYPTISIRANLGYKEKTILTNVSLNVGEGDRIGVIGVNGSGKTTLLKSIAKSLAATKGEIAYHPQTHIGYFSQQQVEMLHLDETPFDHLIQQDPKITDSQARTFLGRFGFNNDRVFDKVSVFSGGEKARLALALLIWQKPNVLVLDEPTNHLDMHIRESLIIALEAFPGALLLVSHDRYFIECCVDQLWLVKNGSVSQFTGTLQDYEAQQSQAPHAKSNTQKTTPPVVLSKENNKKLKALERDITKLEQQLQKIESELADPTLYQGEPSDKLLKLQEKQKRITDDISQKETQWLKLTE